MVQLNHENKNHNEIQFSHWLLPVMFETTNSRTHGSMHFVEVQYFHSNYLYMYIKCTFINRICQYTHYLKKIRFITLTGMLRLWCLTPLSTIFQSVLLVELTWVPGVKPSTCRESLTNFIFTWRRLLHIWYCLFVCLFICLMMLSATFTNISVISWRSVLLVEETGVPGDKHRPVANHWLSYLHDVIKYI